MKTIAVHLPAGSYPVCCGRGLLRRVGRILSAREKSTGVFLLSSPRVWRHWGAKLEGGFRPYGGAKKILFDDDEAAKSIETIKRLCRELARAGADRHAVLVALGGGVVGDVAGFVAASYLRGIRIVQVPTTLVAQADSAIGGKTGVNLPEGKNLVGAFHQPRLVVVDTELLRTLPARQYRSGIYEVSKYSVIGDEPLFRFLERRLDDLLARDAAALDWVLPRCICAKAEVVRRDERESGLRQILNFGHTVGHALEAATHYTRFLHGEAVGWGMIAAAHLAVEMELLGAEDAARIIRLVWRVGPLPLLPKLSPLRLLAVMHADKKARGGELRWVLPRRIGKVAVDATVPEAVVRKVLAELGRLRPQ